MFVEFNNISNDSRLWIYASENKLSEKQERYIYEKILTHIKEWKSHDRPLKGSFKILEGYFIVIALDESFTHASGCSIDTLQNMILLLEKELSISLFNRLNIFCKIDNDIKVFPHSELSNKVSSSTLFYDLTISKKSHFSSFLKPIRDGWCYRLLH